MIYILAIIDIILHILKNNFLGPFPWPFFGNLFYLRKLSRIYGGQHLAFLELCKLYKSGVISVQLGSNKVIVVSDAKLIQEVLHKEEYDGRPWNEFIKMRNMGMKKGNKSTLFYDFAVQNFTTLSKICEKRF